MSAEEGLAWGFFTRVIEQDSLPAAALEFAASLANGPTFAHAMTKRMLHQEWNLSLEVAIEAEAQAQALCMQTEDFRRAYRAFAAKLKPDFEGN
jgi:enoyl-CoA hydratase/carnithine racemase